MLIKRKKKDFSKAMTSSNILTFNPYSLGVTETQSGLKSFHPSINSKPKRVIDIIGATSGEENLKELLKRL